MESTAVFNGLNGQTVTRQSLIDLLELAKKENQTEIIYRISSILNDHNDDKFKIDVIEYKEGLTGAKHTGSYKLALDDCGRLKKGWKFENGKVVKVTSPEKKPASKPASKPAVKQTPAKASLKDKILKLKNKYNFKSFIPNATVALNGSILLDGHTVISEEEILLFENDQFSGLNAAAKDVEQIINELILDKIKNGEKLPAWKQSWAAKGDVLAQNFETKKEYTGSNSIILNVLLGSLMTTPYYLTSTQMEKLGGRIKKGAKSIPLVYYNFVYSLKDFSKNEAAEKALIDKVKGYEVKRKGKPTIVLNQNNYAGQVLTEKEIEFLKLDRNEYLGRGFLRYYRVFNIADTTGIDYEVPTPDTKTEVERIAIAEEIVKGYKDSPPIVLNKKEAVYKVDKDEIGIPDISQFDPKEEYYSTLFHEMIHSTMSKNRLNRIEHYEGKDQQAQYAFEELIAELGASYLCGLSGIINVTYVNQSSYLQGWHEKLQKYTEQYSDFFIYATKEAQKAVDYILKGYNEAKEKNEAPGNKPTENNDKATAIAKAKAKALILKLKLKVKAANQTEKTYEKVFYVEFLDSKNGYKKTKKEFAWYDEAWAFVQKTFDKPNPDLINQY